MRSLLPPGWPRPKGYSNGISATGRMIFTAGVVGWDEREFFPSHRLDGQFAQALKNILAILKEDGAGPEHIVRLTVYVTDIQEYLSQRDELGPIWKSVMGANYPAMALVQVVRLVETAAKVEIEATAVVPGVMRDRFVEDRLPPANQQPDFLLLDYPERLNAAAELLKGGKPGDLALINAHGRWTYAELDDFSGRIARLLVEERGVIPGNRVLLRGPNGYTMFAAWLGILKAGGVAVTTMPLLRPGEIATVIDAAEVSHAIVDSRFIGDFRGAMSQTRYVKHLVKYDGDYGKGELETRCAGLTPLPPIDTGCDDPALIAFTSGTTGFPKGCVQFHRDILAPCDTFARTHFRMAPGDIVMTSAPIAFTFGLGATLLFPLRFGAATATIEQPSPPTMLEAIANFGVTHLATAPTAYKAMLSQPALDEALKTLKCCLSAGEHLPEAVWQAWKERTGISIVDGIGSTEMMHIFISESGDAICPGSTGRAVPGYEATLLDANGKSLAEGEGRLAVKGPTGCRYLDDPRQANYVEGGWNITGDTYRKDEDGYYWYVARSDDMIVSSGYNIGAPEVENALLGHPAVAECAVIGVPCPERGQKVKAFVVVVANVTPNEALISELKNFVKATIAPYKYPREIEFVEALPKTATGKLRRVELRNR